MKRLSALFALLLMLLSISAAAQSKKELKEWFSPMCDRIVEIIGDNSTMHARLSVEKVYVKGGKLQIHFGRYISDRIMREEDLEKINAAISAKMPAKYRDYKNNFVAYSNGTPLASLVGRYASGKGPDAVARSNRYAKTDLPLVRNDSRNLAAPKGLQGRHIAIWHSHGYYYDQSQSRWKWQRPRLFTTCEDLFTQSFVLPYLVSMLENAGACVMLPHERDFQTAELIVDRDTSPRDGIYSETDAEKEWRDTPGKGFAHIRDLYHEGENPFLDGGARQAESVLLEGDASYANWKPDITSDGEYAVYVSYATLPESTTEAHYSVTHNGGTTHFLVNQTMGGGTWIYLGTFGFRKGAAGQGVRLSNFTGRYGEVVTADAVKFGGGMGNVARSPYPNDENGRPRKFDFEADSELSGYPRWCEGSRSWLQWAGMNDTIYSTTRFVDDYVDDYRSRALWVNALMGGSSRAPRKPGYNIPIDLSLAFHSDAGITRTDSIVGTLAIYTKTSDDSDKYPSGGDRNIGREYADIIQSQIVSDIKATMEPRWSRRDIWDKSYYESRLPYVPSMLLELLSHQNFADMRYGLDPNFKFIASRAVYKGMLKFLAYLHDNDYVVQPLPVHSLAVDIEKCTARLSWEPTADPLEPSATADGYIVYTRICDPSDADKLHSTPGAGLDGFDNGTHVGSNSYSVRLEPDKIYSFKVAAVNEGGESLCSEILSAGLASEKATVADVVVINNFDRLAAPASFTSTDTTFAGFMSGIDAGVAYMRDISFTGEQYELRRSAPWLNTEPSSFGASYGNYEDQVLAGNTFDYPLIHGAAIMKAGYSFTSVSRQAVLDGKVLLKRYRICDVICGKQVRTPSGVASSGKNTFAPRIRYSVFPDKLRSALADFTKNGGSLLVSGAYIASDSRDRIYDFELDAATVKNEIEPERKFTEEILKIDWITNKGGHNGVVKGVKSPYKFSSNRIYNIYTTPNSKSCWVESPDGFYAQKGAFTTLRYSDSGIGAAVAYKGETYRSLAIGFPIECLTTQEQIDSMMKEALGFLK